MALDFCIFNLLENVLILYVSSVQTLVLNLHYI